MPTFTAPEAAASFPVFESVGRGVLHVATGSITLAANPTAADILEFCFIPAGATIIGGYLRGDDIDTGTEALDIDIGWAANGVESADTDGLGNFGVITGDAVTEWKPEVSIFLPLNGTLKTGPKTFTNKTKITGVVNAPANAGGTGVLWLTVFYTVA
jgi:hypothetical protein